MSLFTVLILHFARFLGLDQTVRRRGTESQFFTGTRSRLLSVSFGAFKVSRYEVEVSSF